MKRLFVTVLVLFSFLAANSAYSQIIREAELGQPYTFEDVAEIRLLDFSFVKEIMKNEGGKVWGKVSCQNDEEIALLKAEITNLGTEDCEFGKFGKPDYHIGKKVDMSVTVMYRGKITYEGLVGQYSSEKPGTLMYHTFEEEYRSFGPPSLLNITPPTYRSVPVFVSVGKMYSRDFAFFCTLPKRVVNDEKSSLQMIIKIGDNEHEITYSIRK